MDYWIEEQREQTVRARNLHHKEESITGQGRTVDDDATLCSTLSEHRASIVQHLQHLIAQLEDFLFEMRRVECLEGLGSSARKRLVNQTTRHLFQAHSAEASMVTGQKNPFPQANAYFNEVEKQSCNSLPCPLVHLPTACPSTPPPYSRTIHLLLSFSLCMAFFQYFPLPPASPSEPLH